MKFNRRSVLGVGGAVVLSAAAVGWHVGRRRSLIPSIDSTPTADGFRMPAEFERQEAIWLVWPEARIWRRRGRPAQEVVVELANAIAEDTPVRLAATSGQAARVRAAVSGSVEVVEMSAGTGWVRDDGPTFLTNDLGERRGVDWDFNLWGFGGMNRLAKGVSSFLTGGPAEAAQRILQYEGAAGYRAPFVLEGGSIHSDGEGTVITTEECLLNPNRNPQLSKEQIDQNLRSYLGAEKVIWLPLGVFKDGTSGHVDNMCCFARPAEVLLTWTEDSDDEQYERSHEAFEILAGSTDARGRRLSVHKLHQPGPLFASESERQSMPSGSEREFEWSGGRLAGSYVNFVLTNRLVIVPLLDPEHDDAAKEMLASLFPTREVVGVESREILLHGGNLHCISQQVPVGVA